MIVLDEQLLGRNLEHEIARWYQGAVCFITDLRPQMVIKDDGIPRLLREENQPTFITINEKDFWRKIQLSDRYGVVCFSLPDSRAPEIADKLRALLRNPLFDTKAKRMGVVIRITDTGVSYYTLQHRTPQTVNLSG